MTNKKAIKWDVKRGYGVYGSVYTRTLVKWIREGKINEGEVFVWTSGMSGWRRPEELDEFKRIFEKKKKKKKETMVIEVSDKRKYSDIIIIDDEKDMCWLLEKDLGRRHFKVSSANTGRDGLELVRKEEPDIVLLDLKLKDVDGLNVLRKIKEIWPKIKVIVISAFGGVVVKEKASGLGADGFIDKPFKTEDVTKAIKALV